MGSIYDIQCVVMTMTSFRAMPRRGHLDRLKRMCGYLRGQKHFKIHFELEFAITVPFMTLRKTGPTQSTRIEKKS